MYAVPPLDECGSTRKRHSTSIILDSDSDDDFIAPIKKMKHQSVSSSYAVTLLEDVKKDVIDMKSSLADITTLSSKTKCPMALHRILKDTFQCKICRTAPIKPPVILMRCCKSIVGCDTCINNWFSGPSALTKPCPLCRAERGYNETMLLRGLDEFLDQVKVVLQTDDERDEDESPLALNTN